MALLKPLPLDEQIRKMRAALDAEVDARVAKIAKECPGVPAAAIRNSLTRGMGCQCATYLELKAKDDEAEARAAAEKGAAA